MPALFGWREGMGVTGSCGGKVFAGGATQVASIPLSPGHCLLTQEDWTLWPQLGLLSQW